MICNRLFNSVLFLILFVSFFLTSAKDASSQNQKLYSEGKKVVIAKGDKQFAPFEFINEKGQPDGFSVELFKSLMKRIGVPYTLTLDDWALVQSELLDKKIDLAIGMIYSEERANNLNFGIPHCMISYNIICRKDNDISTIDKLSNKSIIVQNKDRAYEYLISSGLTDSIVIVDNIADAIKMLASGKHDAVLSFDVTSSYFVRKGNYDNLIIHITDVNPEKYSIVVNKDNKNLLYMLNSALYQMKMDGEYDKLYDKWFGVFEKNKVYKTIWYILGFLGAFLIILLIFTWLLKRRVNEKTRDLTKMTSESLRLVGELQKENLARKKVEKDLIAAKEKAEESDRLKSTFLANMSHEIRTPLNAILGFSSIMCETEDQETRKQYDEIIAKNNKQLLQLINDILDLSKIESKTIKLNKSNFYINDVCSQTMTTVTSYIENKNIEFKMELDSDCIIYNDQVRVIQVITNFLTNSIKFTEAGTITLSTKHIDDKMIEISVKDTGVGIENEAIDSIFDRFVKLDSFSQGSGLGLAICKQIIELIEGEIGVESQVGQGSRFWIRLLKQSDFSK